mgnify:CR=1 FL=1
MITMFALFHSWNVDIVLYLNFWLYVIPSFPVLKSVKPIIYWIDGTELFISQKKKKKKRAENSNVKPIK